MALRSTSAARRQLEPLIRAFEGLKFDSFGGKVDYQGKVHVIPRPKSAPESLKKYGDLVYVGDPPFELDEDGKPMSNAACLFLPGLFPQIKNPVFIACRVNHAEGHIALAKAVEKLRGSPPDSDEQLRLVMDYYSPLRIIGERQPGIFARKENTPHGAELAELGRLFARHYLGVASDRARIDVFDTNTRNDLIRSGERYKLDPHPLTPRQEMRFLRANQGTSANGVSFYYAPMGRRYLTVSNLAAIAVDFEEKKDRALLARRLSDIVGMRTTSNHYHRLVLHEEVPELEFFGVDDKQFDVVGRMRGVISKAESPKAAVSDAALSTEVSALLEYYTMATLPEYHNADFTENPVFRRAMVDSMRGMPPLIPYELTAEWVSHGNPMAKRILRQLTSHVEGNINIGIKRHSASKRAIVGDKLTAIAEIWASGAENPLLLHVRDSQWNMSSTQALFRRMRDGRLVCRDTLTPEKISEWREASPLDSRTARSLVEEYIQNKRDRIDSHRMFFGFLSDSTLMMNSERLGKSTLWVRDFDPSLEALDKRPLRDYGDLDDAEMRTARVEDTKRIQAGFGRILLVNLMAGNPLIGTGDELYSTQNPGVVRQTDATACYKLDKLTQKITSDQSLYLMASLFEAKTELLSEIMGAGAPERKSIRNALFKSMSDSQKAIEGRMPEVIREARNRFFKSPRSEHADLRWQQPKKLLLTLARYIDPKSSGGIELIDRLINMTYRSGGRVLEPGRENDARILGVLESAKTGALYSSAPEMRRAINSSLSPLLDAGRGLIASEPSVDKKFELVDALFSALGADTKNVGLTLDVINDDASLADAPYDEKIRRLRLLKIRQAINRVSPARVEDVAAHAIDCSRKISDAPAAEDLFVESLDGKFPRLNLTEEDRRFFYEIATDRAKFVHYNRMRYL